MGEIVALYALALAFGGMLFFSGLFSPLIFAKLPIATAGPFLRQVFPWYFLAVAAILAVAAVAFLAAGAEGWGLVLVAMAALGVVNRQVLMPRINDLRDAQLAGDAAAGKGFDRLHKASVAINLVQLLVAGAALTAFL